MKKTLHFLLSFLLLVTITSLFSCQQDNVTPQDPNDIRNEYVGVWRFTENGFLKNGQAQSYVVSISKDPGNSTQVILDNFGNPGDTGISAIGIVTANQIVVSKQTLGNGWEVQGTGKRTSAGNMDWSYSITAGGDINYYTAKAAKQ